MNTSVKRHVPVTALSVEELDAFRRALIRARTAMVQRSNTHTETADELEPTATLGQGETEGTVLEIERSLLGRLNSDVDTAIDEIDAALGRLTDGTFGTCGGCGESIPRERLQALPHARLCRDCQRRDERCR